MPDAPIPNPCSLIPRCPVCLVATLRLARRVKDLDICLCERCGTSLMVPHEAWTFRPNTEPEAER